MSSLVCPVCKIPTAFTPIFISKDAVYQYEEGLEASIQYSGIVKAVMPFFGTYNEMFGILECQSCGHSFVVGKGSGEDWKAVYPIMGKSVSEDIPSPVDDEFMEANLCFAVGAYKACESMCQRVMESVCQDKKVSGLNELLSKGVISKALFDRATEIRLWAGIVKHKSLSGGVDEEDAKQLLTYLEVILNEVYVEQRRLEDLKKKRENKG